LCNRRTTVLFRPVGGDYFLCRFCWHLAYRSQTESKDDRHWRKYHELWREFEDPKTRNRRLAELLPAVDKAWNRASAPGIAAFERHQTQHFSQPIITRAPGRPSKAAKRAVKRRLRELERARRPMRPPGRPKAKRRYRRTKPLLLSERTHEMQAYCPKCRDRRGLRRP
jgi:hypothetical protein